MSLKQFASCIGMDAKIKKVSFLRDINQACFHWWPHFNFKELLYGKIFYSSLKNWHPLEIHYPLLCNLFVCVTQFLEHCKQGLFEDQLKYGISLRIKLFQSNITTLRIQASVFGTCKRLSVDCISSSQNNYIILTHST